MKVFMVFLLVMAFLPFIVAGFIIRFAIDCFGIGWNSAISIWEK